MLKAYSKGDEIHAKGHQLPLALYDTSLAAFADDLLRVELQLRGKELKENSLHLAANWGDNTASEVFASYLSRLQISEATMIDSDTLKDVPPRLQLAYQAWKDGHDLRQTLPRATWYRYRKELMEYGVDIALQQPGREESNVVPLRVVLHAHPVSVPDWALGTDLYFDPPKLVINRR
jgi:II/X family phage/plasmid replication protein